MAQVIQTLEIAYFEELIKHLPLEDAIKVFCYHD